MQVGMSSLPRILVVGPDTNFGWTESTARALEAMGCAVSTIFYNRLPFRQELKGARRILGEQGSTRLLEAPQWVRGIYSRLLTVQRIRRVIRAARTVRPDIVLILKGDSFTPAMLRKLKAATQALLAIWWTDHPFMIAEFRRPWPLVPSCVPLYDHCFVFDRSYESILREAGARAVSFLPCAADPDLFVPQELEVADQVAYGASVSFIGAYYKSRAPIISALADEPDLRVWGPGWKQWPGAKLNGLAGKLKGEARFHSETCKIYNASLVNLNLHHPQSQVAGLNCRAFEILASGSFELTNYVPGMEELLEPGREVAVFHSPSEAVELTRYYIKAADERRRMAEYGRRRVLAEHTYRHRMQSLLAALST